MGVVKPLISNFSSILSSHQTSHPIPDSRITRFRSGNLSKVPWLKKLLKFSFTFSPP